MLNSAEPATQCDCGAYLRGSLPKSGLLDFATKIVFPLFFVGEEAFVASILKTAIFLFSISYS